MSSGKLTTTSYLVLGMIALRGPSTPYELKRAVARSIGHFWSFPHAQLYREPARIAAFGLLTEKREETGRRRRVYSLAEPGRRALRAWLGEPVRKLHEFRDLAMLKLFYGELATASEIVALASDQLAFHRERLATYEALAARYGDRPGLAVRTAPLTFGLMFERSAVAFWEGIAEQPPIAEQSDLAASGA